MKLNRLMMTTHNPQPHDLTIHNLLPQEDFWYDADAPKAKDYTSNTYIPFYD